MMQMAILVQMVMTWTMIMMSLVMMTSVVLTVPVLTKAIIKRITMVTCVHKMVATAARWRRRTPSQTP